MMTEDNVKRFEDLLLSVQRDGIQKLVNYINKKVLIKYNLGRNKYDTYEAIIKNLYNCVFLVE